MSKRSKENLEKNNEKNIPYLFSIQVMTVLIAAFLKIADRKSHSQVSRHLDSLYHSQVTRQSLQISDIATKHFYKNVKPEYIKLFKAIREEQKKNRYQGIFVRNKIISYR